MSYALDRFEGALALYGESVTIAGNGATALVAVLSPERADAYLTQAQLDAAAGPVLALYVSAGTAVAASDAVVRDGTAYTVQRVLPLIHRGTTLGRLAVCT